MKENTTDKILLLCREYDKYEGRGVIIYDTGADVTKINVEVLRIRSRFNPELAYYLVLESNYRENKEKIEEDILNENKFLEFDAFINNGSSSLDNRGIVRI